MQEKTPAPSVEKGSGQVADAGKAQGQGGMQQTTDGADCLMQLRTSCKDK
jgi:hypothetical protein